MKPLVATVLFVLLWLALAAAGAVGQNSSGSGAATPIPAAPGEDVIWYISPSGSPNISTCGHTIENPCDSLATIIAGSPLFNLSGALCYDSEGATDGRASTTVVFLEGDNFVPATCLTNWMDIRFAGRAGATITSIQPAQGGFFQFVNCTNVTIEGLTFATSRPGQASLYFRESQGISVRDCTIPVLSIASYGITLDDCMGEVVFEGTTFFGDPSFLDAGIFVAAALRVNLGLISNGFIPITPFSTAFPPINMTIRNCIFRDIASSDSTTVRRSKDSYQAVHTAGVGLVINFFLEASDNHVMVESSQFHRISVPASSGVTVNYDSGSVNNHVVFKDCEFMNNSVRYGGGIASYFYTDPQNSTLEVENCTFMENRASFEGGGVLAVLISRDVSNRVHIKSSRFIRNYAQYGAGVFLFNSPSWFNYGPVDAVAQPLAVVNISDCVFDRNEALLQEGVVNTLRMLVGLSGSK